MFASTYKTPPLITRSRVSVFTPWIPLAQSSRYRELAISLVTEYESEGKPFIYLRDTVKLCVLVPGKQKNLPQAN